MSIKKIKLDFEIDELTNCIVNSLSGDAVNTEINIIDYVDLNILRYGNWKFDWVKEHGNRECTVYKLTTIGNPRIIQGLISLSDRKDHIEMKLIENNLFNQGKNRLYYGVAGNMVAFACKLSFELGYEGYLTFTAKTKLITHYQNSLNAKRYKGNDMYIDSLNSLNLVKKYYPEYEKK